MRWALTLALNIQAVVTDYLGGTAKLTNIPVPSTPALTAIYHDPMEEWFQNLEIEIEEGVMLQALRCHGPRSDRRQGGS